MTLKRFLVATGFVFLILGGTGLYFISQDTATILWLTVVNKSSESIKEVVLAGPGSSHFLSSISAQSMHFERVDIKGEGEVKFLVTVGTITNSGILLGYITPGLVQGVTIFVDENAKTNTAITKGAGELRQHARPRSKDH